ncbi:MAG TPA: adenosylcobinamide-GDP ribazoletransferase [Bauldia sp.]|nr:adenosylcobinamide-GDP ribazoletransferase [Bauldia sp.]
MSDSQGPSEIGVAIAELRSASIFLTRVPPRYVGASPTEVPDFRHAARVFPVVGAAVGLAGGVVLLVANTLGMSALVCAGLAIATTAIVTGSLHEDGLADATDSLGGATTEKKLAIMDDSRVGTYGAVALILSIVLRVAALAAVAVISPLSAALVLIAAEAVSRAALVRLWHDLPAARLGGLSNDAGVPDQNAMLVAIAVAAVIAVVLGLPAVGLWPTILAGTLAIVATYVVIRVTARTLGGRTGDTLGACQQAAVVAFLIGASVS